MNSVGTQQLAFLAAMKRRGAQVWRQGRLWICTSPKDGPVVRLGDPSLSGLLNRGLVRLTTDGIKLKRRVK